MAGCESIWIVCNDDMQPLIRHRLGDYVQDPVYLYRNHDPNPMKESRRPIPIYYVPVHPKDRERRDCLAWSVLYGAMSAFWVGRQISKWVVPNRYYTAFPYGVYDPEILREHRRDISSDRGFYLSHEGKTIKDNEYLGFTFSPEEFKQFRRTLRKKSTGEYSSDDLVDGKYPRKKLPPEERWSARLFSLDTVFGNAIIDGTNIVELPQYYNIGNWSGLKNYLGSNFEILRPNKDFLSYREFNKIAEDADG